jgi:hypothetical protein
VKPPLLIELEKKTGYSFPKESPNNSFLAKVQRIASKVITSPGRYNPRYPDRFKTIEEVREIRFPKYTAKRQTFIDQLVKKEQQKPSPASYPSKPS